MACERDLTSNQKLRGLARGEGLPQNPKPLGPGGHGSQWQKGE